MKDQLKKEAMMEEAIASAELALPSLIENIRKDWLQFVQTLPKQVGETPEKVIADWWISHLTHAIEEAIGEEKVYWKKYPAGDYADGAIRALDTILATLKEINYNKQ